MKALFDESESILCKQFFINFNFDFGVLAQKCLKLCANGVLKFQFFFLNVSSKVLAGVGVRTSKISLHGHLCCHCLYCNNFCLDKGRSSKMEKRWGGEGVHCGWIYNSLL